jgi:hypothetical protein
MKKLLSLILVTATVLSLSVTAFAEETVTTQSEFEKAINSLDELEPYTKENAKIGVCDWTMEWVDNAITGEMSNYEKVKAVYDYCLNEVKKDQQEVNNGKFSAYSNCLFDQMRLRQCLNTLRLDEITVQFTGEPRAQNGGWTGHNWIGIELNDKYYYFDTNLPGRYGTAVEKCFAIPEDNTSLYR